MTITKSIINKNYQEILRQNSGAEFIKVDLHVHTPASGDAQAKNKYNFKFNVADIPKSLKYAEQMAGDIVDGVVQKGIRLIAVTDHNSPSNTHPEDLTNTWYQLLKDKAKGKELSVLPGVEISTDDLHILVILDPKEDEPTAYTTHRINFLLQDCKFSLKEYGDYRATGMSSLFDVLQYLEDLSTSCIAIPAHIDGGKKAMLTVYKEPSNVFNKLLKS
jgi:3',5'-cyclic AMP phosphodiesterase CpdA